MEFNKDNIIIDSVVYYKILHDEYNENSVNNLDWAEQNGIEFLGEVYLFKVKDEKKWLLAKIKYGL